jgi:DUF917 family protein
MYPSRTEYERYREEGISVGRIVLATLQDCEDFVHGLTFCGTGGGGGQPERGIQILAEQIQAGREIEVVDVTDLPGDAWTVMTAGMGGRPPAEGPDQEELARLGLEEVKYERGESLTAVIRELAEYAGVEIAAIMPGELGSGNTPIPLVTALQMGVPSVDGDYAGGRAIPEIRQTLPEILGKSICPMAYLDRWGNVCIVKEAVSGTMVDRIGRMFALAGFGGIAFAGYLMQAGEVGQFIEQGSLTRALAIGRARRTALEEGKDPACAMAQAAQGWVLFRGVVQAAEWEDRGEGYMFGYGTNHFQGLEEYEGQSFRIWYKNENHISWLNGEPFVTSPDCMGVVDLKTGEALTNSAIAPHQSVAIVGWPGSAIQRTERGLEAIGPRYFGFNIDYVPIEERL